MKIAVSACMLGRPCRYDGRAKPCAQVIALADRHELVAVCPEAAGGLAIPHPPSEIVAGAEGLRVVDAQGADNTAAFVRGAKRTLARVLDAGCDAAVLKAKSPSCGVRGVYDGSFSGTLVEGMGVAARALHEAGVPVFDEGQLDELERLAQKVDGRV